jgi:predicted transcriptional regulator
MLPKYRSRTDIVASILQSANGRQVTKIKLMYGAFLSYVQLKGYLFVLIENGLLEYHKETNTYRTSENGIKFLTIYEKMAEMTLEMKHR